MASSPLPPPRFWPRWLESFLAGTPTFVRVLVFLHIWLLVVGGIVVLLVASFAFS